MKACSFSAWQIAGLRSGIAALVILYAIPNSRRGWSKTTWWVGASYAVTLLSYIAANKLTTAANAIFLQSTAPLYVLASSSLLLGERPTRRDITAAAIIAAGMAIICVGKTAPLSTAPHPVQGNWLGLVSGLTWAITIIGLRHLGRAKDGGGTGAGVVAGNILTLGFAMLFGWPFENGTTTDWLWIAYLGLGQVGLAYVFVTRATPHVPAVQIALILMIEPTLNPVIAWLVHDEVPSPSSLVGGASILCAVALQTGGRRTDAARR